MNGNEEEEWVKEKGELRAMREAGREGKRAIEIEILEILTL